jgi:propionyl-CoA carboxylase alpha chain
MFYDPMIAKLVTHAPTREKAIDAQAEALDQFTLDGIQHNIPFLTALMQHPRWRKGALSTGFIKEEFPNGFVPRAPDASELDILAAVGAHIDNLGNLRRRAITHQMGGVGVRFATRRIARVGGISRMFEVAGGEDGPTYVTYIDAAGKRGATVEVSSPWWPGEPVWRGSVGGKQIAVQVRPTANGVQLAYRGLSAPVLVYTEREAELAALMPEKSAADTSKVLLCPMPGLVKAIHVLPGQDVKAGDALAVVEAMKMENILRSERDATVKSLAAKPGDSLAVDAVILEFV